MLAWVVAATGFSVHLRAPHAPPQASVRHAAVVAADGAYGASHTSFYTDAVAKDSYPTLEEVLSEKMSDPELRKLTTSMLDVCGKITDALRTALVTVAGSDNQFGDVQLGVDVIADELMWDTCKTDPLVNQAASEEEPEVVTAHADGKFCVCWDPLDGSSIVDNNWAVGTIIGIWPASKGIIGATGRDQASSGARVNVGVVARGAVTRACWCCTGDFDRRAVRPAHHRRHRTRRWHVRVHLRCRRQARVDLLARAHRDQPGLEDLRAGQHARCAGGPAARCGPPATAFTCGRARLRTSRATRR